MLSNLAAAVNLFTFFIVFLASTADAQMLCQQIFQSADPSNEHADLSKAELKNALQGFVTFHGSETMRITTEILLENGQPGFLAFEKKTSSTQVVYWPKKISAKVEVIKVKERPSTQSFLSPDIAAERGMSDFLKLIDEPVDFVLGTYQKRRTHWPEHFLKHLKEFAHEYAVNSTYINIRGKTNLNDFNSSEDTLLGTLRIIKEKDGHLPMEEYLGIRLDTPGLVKLEPGNLAVLPDFNQDTFDEILFRLLSHIESGDPSIMFTYADRQSRMIYRGLGFRPVPATELNLAPGDVDVQILGNPEDGVRITKDGVEWTPMKCTMADFRAALDKLSQNGLRGSEEENKMELLRQRDQKIQQRSLSEAHTGVIVKASDSNFLKAEISAVISQNSNGQRLFSYQVIRGTDAGNSLAQPRGAWILPQGLFPLHEGFHQVVEENRFLENRFQKYGEVEYSYNNGLLYIRETTTIGGVNRIYGVDLEIDAKGNIHSMKSFQGIQENPIQEFLISF